MCFKQRRNSGLGDNCCGFRQQRSKVLHHCRYCDFSASSRQTLHFLVEPLIFAANNMNCKLRELAPQCAQHVHQRSLAPVPGNQNQFIVIPRTSSQVTEHFSRRKLNFHKTRLRREVKGKLFPRQRRKKACYLLPKQVAVTRVVAEFAEQVPDLGPKTELFFGARGPKCRTVAHT